MTVGSDQDPAAQAIVAMGGKHIQKSVTVSSTMILLIKCCLLHSLRISADLVHTHTHTSIDTSNQKYLRQ